VLAVCTMATMKGDGARLVMSQAAPTSCIHVPISETTLAIQRVLKKACLRGLQVEVCKESSFGMAILYQFAAKKGRVGRPCCTLHVGPKKSRYESFRTK
jgi:hypothetical protein